MNTICFKSHAISLQLLHFLISLLETRCLGVNYRGILRLIPAHQYTESEELWYYDHIEERDNGWGSLPKHSDLSGPGE